MQSEIKCTHNDFIGVYDNVFNDYFCDKLIDLFEVHSRNNKTFGREPDEIAGLIKNDQSICVEPRTAEEINLVDYQLLDFFNVFNDRFWGECYKLYSSQYEIINTLSSHTIRNYKLQKTLPSQGYHVFHCESAHPNDLLRYMVYTVYLNDIEDGGETEFLYQSTRVKPKKGRVTIFPASYTHTHRGNPPLSGEKYILTGWIVGV